MPVKLDHIETPIIYSDSTQLEILRCECTSQLHFTLKPSLFNLILLNHHSASYIHQKLLHKAQIAHSN